MVLGMLLCVHGSLNGSAELNPSRRRLIAQKIYVKVYLEYLTAAEKETNGARHTARYLLIPSALPVTASMSAIIMWSFSLITSVVAVAVFVAVSATAAAVITIPIAATTGATGVTVVTTTITITTATTIAIPTTVTTTVTVAAVAASVAALVSASVAALVSAASAESAASALVPTSTSTTAARSRGRIRHAFRRKSVSVASSESATALVANTASCAACASTAGAESVATTRKAATASASAAESSPEASTASTTVATVATVAKTVAAEAAHGTGGADDRSLGVTASTEAAAETTRFPAFDGAAALDVDEDAAVFDTDAVGFFIGGCCCQGRKKAPGVSQLFLAVKLLLHLGEDHGHDMMLTGATIEFRGNSQSR
jgi:hypothetical protein